MKITTANYQRDGAITGEALIDGEIRQFIFNESDTHPLAEEFRNALKSVEIEPYIAPKEERLEAALIALEAEKETALKELKVEYDGARYDADERSQLRVTGAVTLLSLAPEGTRQEWIDADNVTRDLTISDLAAIGSLIAQRVTEIALAYRAAKDAAIESAAE
ncbi:MAG: DUF4376 domain-containing protein [Helicobacteraceae bacterium]|jgi:hypothetical protein|nr:DUF4376 domain-containing protein [Helicobacteraceae bacterium]